MPNIDPAMAILIPPAILGLVEFFKTFGLAGRALTAVSFVIGALVGAGLFNKSFKINSLAACKRECCQPFRADKVKNSIIHTFGKRPPALTQTGWGPKSRAALALIDGEC